MTTVMARGVQTPRILHVPADASYDVADDALAWLDEVVGFDLDEWQQMVLRESLAESRPGSWAATEVGLVVPRQNGKGAILEARELVGLFLLREKLLIHSAHQFKTAQEHFLRIVGRIEDVPELKKRVHAVRTGAGEQGVILKTGERLRFLARKGGSGRGFSAPFVAFDEAMDLPEGTVADMVPTQSAMPRRQRWYTGSAVDQFEQSNGVTFTRVRESGVRGDNPRLAFFEWSLDVDTPDLLDHAVMLDDDAIAAANPGYGIRIFRESVEDELHSLGDRSVAVERFGVGDWPPTTVGSGGVIDVDVWESLKDQKSQIASGSVLAFDVTPDRSRSAIGAAGFRADGLLQVEVVKHELGTEWVVADLVGMVERNDPLAVVCAGRSPAAALVPALEEAGVKVTLLSDAEHADATGGFFDRVKQATLRHLGSGELLSAIKGATTRLMGDGGWAWSRKNSAVDISPLVAVTLASLLARDDDGETHIF